MPSRRWREGDAYRQSGAAGGDRGGGDAVRRARGGRPRAAPGVRRQPGRAHHVGDRAGGDRATRRVVARAAVARTAGARRGSRARARHLCPLCIAAEVSPFFPDLPARIAGAHLVVARSGASTVAELAAIGRPSILVPLPGALDQDQFANAGVLAAAGGAIRLPQTDFTPARLAAEITALAGGLAAAQRRWRRPRDRRARPTPPTGSPTW